MTRIRPLVPNDADFYAAIQNDSAVRSHIGPPLNVTPEVCREQIEDRVGALGSLFIVEDEKDATQIGICGFTPNNNFAGTDTLIQLVSEHQGQRIGSRVLSILIDRWFSDPENRSLYASVSPRNQSAIRLLERFNFEYESRYVDARGAHFHKYALRAANKAT